jgi:hypothetical protein
MNDSNENSRRLLNLGTIDASVRVTYPTGRPELAPRTPSVCSTWDKPQPIDLARLSGLDLENCGWLIRTPQQLPTVCSPDSIQALLSAHIILLGIDGSFANASELVEAGIVVLEGLALTDVPRVGFCVTISESVIADVQNFTWTL